MPVRLRTVFFCLAFTAAVPQLRGGAWPSTAEPENANPAQSPTSPVEADTLVELAQGVAQPAPASPVTTPGVPAPTPSAAAAALDTVMAQPTPARPRGLSLYANRPRIRMIGDQSSLLSIHQQINPPFPPPIPNPLPSPNAASSLIATVRGLKISENQSPEPQDRIYFSSNFFSNVNQHLNIKLNSPVADVRVYRQVFGFEKTFFGGQASLGMSLPLNSIWSNSTIPGDFNKPGGEHSALGDLSIYGKAIVWEDPETGSLLTTGAAISMPTGPATFAGASYLPALNPTSLQPFMGYILARDRFFIHGFFALDTPTSIRAPTLLYNDVGIGYYLFASQNPNVALTALVPTFETHVNVPLTHADPYNVKDIGGVPTVVTLTYGLNAEFFHRSVFTFGFINPVTGPRPFDFEVVLLFNFAFGGRRAPRMIGG